jgi:hypothetical protein
MYMILHLGFPAENDTDYLLLFFSRNHMGDAVYCDNVVSLKF